MRKKKKTKKTKGILQLTYLHRAGESPRRQPPKGGIHPEKVPRKNNNPHGFPFLRSLQKLLRDIEREGGGGGGAEEGGGDAREASEKRKKTKKKKRKEERKMREVYFPPFLFPAVFLFHDGLVGFFPCSVRSGESCGGSRGGGGGGGGVSGAHVKTEGERVGKVARMIGELEEQSAWTHWTCAPRLSLSLFPCSLTHTPSLSPPATPLLPSLLHLTLFPFPCLPSLTCCNAESRGCSLLIRLGRGSCKEKPP